MSGNKTSWLTLSGLGLLLLLTPTGRAASYQVIDLHPADTDEFVYSSSGAFGGVSNGEEGGYVDTTVDDNITQHAAVWTGSSASFVDLNPTGFDSSQINLVSNGQKIGVGYTPDFQSHALLWTDNIADHAIDLTPSGFTSSMGLGTNGVYQSGTVSVDNYFFTSTAAVWNGTAGSFQNFGPSGSTYYYSEIWGLSRGWSPAGGQLVGDGFLTADPSTDHALLWTGDTPDAIDLNPDGFIGSGAYATDGAHQVGYGIDSDGNSRALVWSGSAASAIDVTPAGYTNSCIYGIFNGDLFGAAWNDSDQSQAILWTPDGLGGYRVTDLNDFLPDGYGNATPAGIDADGSIAGYATAPDEEYHAILWEEVPEPASGALIVMGASLILSRRR